MKLNHFKGLVRLKSYRLINYFPKSRKSGNTNEVSKNKPFFGAHREIQLIMMTLSFIVCWAPFGMVYLVKLLGFREKGSHHKSDVLTLLCVKLACGIITPIVCVFENIQVSFKDLINLGIIKSGIFPIQYIFELITLFNLIHDSVTKRMNHKILLWVTSQTNFAPPMGILRHQSNDELVFDI